jgi:hypothetical protein
MSATDEVSASEEAPTGLEDVTRSMRALARQTRTLGGSAAKVAERELAMAIRIASRLRDETISSERLERLRNAELAAHLRQDAHNLVDVVADLGAVMGQSVVDFVERFLDERRLPVDDRLVPVARFVQAADA